MSANPEDAGPGPIVTADDWAASTWEAIGEELGRARRLQRLSKRKAAAAIGVSEGSWRHYEAGGRKIYGTWVLPNPDAATLDRIAEVFGVLITHNGPDDDPQWEYEVVEPRRTAPEGAAAASGDPSHLTDIMSELTEAVRDLRDEVQRLRQQRGNDEVGST